MSATSRTRFLRPALIFLCALPCVLAMAQQQEPVAIGPSIIPNGDFSQGNQGFKSDLPYVKPAFNCLWPANYTLASTFNHIQLHQLIGPDPFSAPKKRTGKEQVMFMNAGGVEPLMIWSAKVTVQPRTKYFISFNSVSLSGHIEGGNPPHQVATEEWVPTFNIWADDASSGPIDCGMGKYYRGGMYWTSGKATEVTLKIVRDKMLNGHTCGLLGISNIEMVPVK